VTEKQGLWIDGNCVGHSAQDFQSVLKYALVVADDQNRPAFRSEDVAKVMALMDDLSVEIALAMINDYRLHDFENPKQLADNIALRKGVIAAMGGLCAGQIDGDYVEAGVGVPPTLGYLRNLEVLYAAGAQTGEGILTKEAPFAAPHSSWARVPDTDSWAGYTFMQRPDVLLSKALSDVTPFRGECAGALQVSILTGCLNGLGAAKVDALRDHFGPAFIGAWRVPVKRDTSPVLTAATQFLSQLHDVPTDYQRGSTIAVPGDYLYFKNKDDYATRSQMGGWLGDPKDDRRGSWHGVWRGENCVYMGKDALGDPHYSGMGLAWKTEFALRMFLGNAYFADANCTYLKTRRAGLPTNDQPVIVEDPLSQIRFTKRAVMRYPDLTGVAPPDFRLSTLGATPLSDDDIRDRLGDLDFKQINSDVFQSGPVKLETLMNALHIADTQLQQLPGGAAGDAELAVLLGHWSLHIAAVDRSIQNLTSADMVHVHAVDCSPKV
jgi:hypothetical protein